MDIAAIFIGALVTGVSGLFLAFVVRIFNTRVKITSPEMRDIVDIKKVIGILEKESEQRSNEIKALFSLQGPQITALIALLEATKGKANGRIDSAISKMLKAEEEYARFLIDGLGCQ